MTQPLSETAFPRYAIVLTRRAAGRLGRTPPVGPSSGSKAAQTMEAAPSAMGRPPLPACRWPFSRRDGNTRVVRFGPGAAKLRRALSMSAACVKMQMHDKATRESRDDERSDHP
jgi:hypothetical protein